MDEEDDILAETQDDDFNFSEENEAVGSDALVAPPTEQPPTEQPSPEPTPVTPTPTPTPQDKTQEAIAKLAAAYGMSTEEYIAAVETQAHEAEIQAQIEKGIPREVAERLLNLENQSKLQQEQQALAQKQAAEKQQFSDFVAKYPEVKELPPEVITALDKGIPLIYAYAEYENKQLKSKLAAYEKNSANKQRSTGSMIGEAGDSDKDDFLSGFNL